MTKLIVRRVPQTIDETLQRQTARTACNAALALGVATLAGGCIAHARPPLKIAGCIALAISLPLGAVEAINSVAFHRRRMRARQTGTREFPPRF